MCDWRLSGEQWEVKDFKQKNNLLELHVQQCEKVD